MTSLGVFRDDVYNAINVLTDAQFNSTSQTGGVLAASILSSAVENYITSTSTGPIATDSAVNIIANMQQAVAAAYKTTNAGFGASVNPLPGVPNLFNMTFFVSIQNTNGATLTITAGTGVTLVGTATILTANTRTWMVTVTSATTVTFQTLGAVLTVA
jgi:hypothetical protein